MTVTPSSQQTSHVDTGPALPGKLAAMIDALTDEIAGRLATPARRADIDAQVREALLDLDGSVSSESLAEMASRLAEHRLNTTRPVSG